MTKDDFFEQLQKMQDEHFVQFYSSKKKPKYASCLKGDWVSFIHHPKDLDKKYLALLRKAEKEPWFADHDMRAYRKDLEQMRGC